MCVNVYIHICVYMSDCLCTCIYVVYIYKYVFVYICIYVCVFEMPLILLSLIFCGQLLVSLIIGFCMFCNQEAKEQEVRGLEGQVSAIQQVLSDLKVQLYAKFGNNINLEADES